MGEYFISKNVCVSQNAKKSYPKYGFSAYIYIKFNTTDLMFGKRKK